MSQPTGPSGEAPPQAFGPYVLVRQLGAGAFGAVYEARKAPLDKRVALKILHREKARDGAMTARFLQEARAAASLKHPHIVEVDDLGVVDGIPYIAMEFLDGEPLTALLARERELDVGRALDVMLPVLSAVASVHEAGIVHRDLKPDNIFLWRALAGRVHPKVLDFGIAKVAEHGGSPTTQTGYVLGTPDYMSIEQWTGSKNATAGSDQWALGAILYECLTGHRPFEADGIMAIAMRVSSGPPTPMRAYVLTVPPEVEAIVMRTMARDPHERFPSVRAFAAALLPYASPATRAMWSAEFERAAVALHPPTVEHQAPPQVPTSGDAWNAVAARPQPQSAYGTEAMQPYGPMAPPITQASRTPDTFAAANLVTDARMQPARKTWPLVALSAVIVLGVIGFAMRALSSAGSAGQGADAGAVDASVATPPPPSNDWPAGESPSTPKSDRPAVEDHDEPTPGADEDKTDEDDASADASARVRTPPLAPTAPQSGLSPMQQAQACRSIANDSDRNECVIYTLQERARTQQELGMLASAQMAEGHRVAASRTMRRYILRYPNGPLVPSFQRYLDGL